MKFLSSAAAAFALISSVPALAEPAEMTEETAERHLKEAEEVVGASGPIQRSAGGSSFSAFEFGSEQGETTVSLSLAFNLKRYDPVESNEDGFYNVSSLKLTTKGETPIDEKSGFPKILSGDSLVSGSKITVGLTRFSTKLGDGRKVEGIEDRSLVMCVDEEAKIWRTANPGLESNELVERFMSDYLVARTSFTPENALTKISGKFPKISGHIQPACFSGDIRKVVRKYNPNEFATWDSGYFDQSNSWFMGIDASVGKDAYSFLDRTAFLKDSVDRTSWEVGAYLGFIGNDLTWSGRGKIVYGKSYKSPDEAQICRAVAGSPDPECLKGPDGKPVRSRDGLVSFEFRKLFMLNETNKVGIAPQLTYRFDDHAFGAELPIYLSRDKDGKLNGGLKIGYDSKDDEVAVGIFVGAPLSIFFD